jgi:Transposase DDE domain
MDPLLVAGDRAGTHIGNPIHLPGTFALPFKYHAGHRHHIPKRRYRVTNWSEYDASLRQRGSLTVWFTDEAIQAWRAEPRATLGGQPHYSALAITTALTLRMVFGLALRQTDGLIGSVTGLLGLDLAVPDHSTLSRRAKTLEAPPLRRAGNGPLHLLVDSTGLKLGGAGEWLGKKPVATICERKSRRRSGDTNVWSAMPFDLAPTVLRRPRFPLLPLP